MSDNNEVRREYDNGEITVVWLPAKCFHAAFCWKELPEVFDPKKRPWVNIHGASSERIRKQVERCPSGALTYYESKDKNKETMEKKENEYTKVKVHHAGPLFIAGCVEVEKGDGAKEKTCDGAAFCRCGGSKNQPYCDGTHIKTGFDK